LDERRRRGALAALAFTLLLGGLVGCGSDTFLGSEEEGSGQGVTLNWFVATQPGGTIQEVAKRCSDESNGEYTVNVELLPTTASDQREQLVRRLGAEDSTVDIIGMDVIWTAEFANAGWLREWPDPQAQQVTKDIFPTVIDTASFEGKLYGAPFNSNTELLWYRTDLVKQPPTTWDEMISEAERLNKFVQVQANRYEGFTVWVNAMIESAGTQILSGPETVDLAEGPTDDALAMIGKLANSPAAAPDIDTSTEDTARLGFESGSSAFMLNYTFALSSAEANAPDIAKNMGAAVYPEVVPGKPSKPPLGGFNLGVSAFSNHPDEAFDAATCLSNVKSQLTATELDGLPPSNQTLYATKTVRKAFPGFSDEIEKSIENAGPRPLTPAYSDLSLAIQRSLHPPADIDPNDPMPKYDDLRSNLEDAVKREGLL
jgi:multiple sugar transport system substrate-binding protein